MMRALSQWYKREPVRAMQILKTLFLFAISFAVHLTIEQRAMLITLGGLIFGASGEITRSQVSPIATMPIAAKVSIDAQEKAEDQQARLAQEAADIQSGRK
jgi:hypothetical protein